MEGQNNNEVWYPSVNNRYGNYRGGRAPGVGRGGFSSSSTTPAASRGGFGRARGRGRGSHQTSNSISIDEQINKVRNMSEEQVRAVLRYHQIQTDGSIDVLRKRLTTFLCQENQKNENNLIQTTTDTTTTTAAAASAGIDNNCPEMVIYHNPTTSFPAATAASSLKYLLIIDFEATCESKELQEDFSKYPHEIIEFPMILYNVQDNTVVDTFHSYCRPIINPQLSNFCQQLTGISQAIVNQANDFPIVLQNAEHWLNLHEIYNEPSCIVSDCNADVARFLRQQCAISNLSIPIWAKYWINIRKLFRNYYNIVSKDKMTLQDILHALGLQFQGQPHSGLDDAKNLLRVVQAMLQDGCELRTNECLNLTKPPHFTDSLSRRQAVNLTFVYSQPFNTTTAAATATTDNLSSSSLSSTSSSSVIPTTTTTASSSSLIQNQNESSTSPILFPQPASSSIETLINENLQIK